MANFYFTFVFLFVSNKVYSTSKIFWKCATEFCEDYVQRFPCPPLDPSCSNPNKSLVIPSLTTCNCCEHCFIFQDLGENCIMGHPGQPLPNVMCKPNTVCHDGKCVKMPYPDSDFYRSYECERGRCYCTTIGNNNEVQRIFGSFEETKDIMKEKQCGCSRFASLAKQSVNKVLPISDTFLPTLRCLPNGQFEPLQCIDNMCGCVDKATGTWDTTVRKVIESAIGPNNPKCFDSQRHKIGQYYTNCEKERNSLMSDMSLQESQDIDILLLYNIECTPDGEYTKSKIF